MIPNVTKGSDPGGLMRYLAGPGDRNEHEFPHLVAGSDGFMSWYADQELSAEDAQRIGSELEQPRRVFGTHVQGGHVRHISLSVPRDDGQLGDGKWQTVAEDFMQKMGYIGVEGKSDTRWVAVHHGPSGQNGNDHIHLVVNLVRQDGTKAETWKDFPRSQQACREIEQEQGLFVIRGVSSHRQLSPGEREASIRRGRVEPERDTLERIVRAASVSAVTEDEFVRRLRGEGLLVRASLGKEGQVRGFSVAVKPPKDERAVFYGGSVVARDLGLGVLRQRWPQDAGSRAAADAEWAAAARGHRVVGAGAEQRDPTFTAGQLSTELKAWKEKLAALPVDDHEGWRQASADLAGAFAAWSRATEKDPGPLAAVAKELGRSAQLSRSQYRPRGHDHSLSVRTSVMLTHLATKDDPRAVLAVFERMKELAAVIRDHQAKNADLLRVRGLNTMARERLIGLNQVLHAQAGLSTGEALSGPSSRPAQRVMPAKLMQEQTVARTRATTQKGK